MIWDWSPRLMIVPLLTGGCASAIVAFGADRWGVYLPDWFLILSAVVIGLFCAALWQVVAETPRERP